jgi:hypothetical protein
MVERTLFFLGSMVILRPKRKKRWNQKIILVNG